MSKATGNYLMIAAVGGAAFIIVLVFSLERRGALWPARHAQRPGAAAASGEQNATAPATASATPASGEQALPAPDPRQLAKIVQGMRRNPEGGILVEATPPGSAAEQLHLQPGDVIVRIDGIQASAPAQFQHIYREQGLPQELTILRNGAEVHLRSGATP